VLGSAEDRIFTRQLAKATGPDGTVDMQALRRLVVGLYEEATQDRRRSDRSLSLMAEELEGANRKLRALVEDLRVQNLRFEAALDHMPHGLCMFDADDRLVVVNRRYQELMGLPEQLARIGITHRALLHAKLGTGDAAQVALEMRLAAHRALVAAAADVPTTEEFEEGRCRIRATYSQMPGGGWIGIFEDVTDQRAADARAAAAARLSSLGEMAAGLAHELKQPLAAISLAAGNAEKALARGDAGSVALRLGRIVGQATRGGALIDHLRRFARGWDAASPMAPVSLRDAVDGVLTLVGGTLREAGVAVEVDLPPELPPVLAFQMALEQVLLNLLMNAHDAIVAGGGDAPRRIAVRAATHGDAVRVEVADSGGGIPAAVMQRLFQPFVTTKGPDRGTGLGLSICHGLVTTMGGTIEAENGGDGAVFRITLSPAQEPAPERPGGAHPSETLMAG
jgi:C4-dicarboxylate-specific signal transduction histidine kinase